MPAQVYGALLLAHQLNLLLNNNIIYTFQRSSARQLYSECYELFLYRSTYTRRVPHLYMDLVNKLYIYWVWYTLKYRAGYFTIDAISIASPKNNITFMSK